MLVEKAPFCLLACVVTHSSQYSSFTLNFFLRKMTQVPLWDGGGLGKDLPTVTLATENSWFIQNDIQEVEVVRTVGQ